MKPTQCKHHRIKMLRAVEQLGVFPYARWCRDCGALQTFGKDRADATRSRHRKPWLSPGPRCAGQVKIAAKPERQLQLVGIDQIPCPDCAGGTLFPKDWQCGFCEGSGRVSIKDLRRSEGDAV